MSYLDVPRLHFSGTFIAKPSTVNNTPQNFDPSVTNPDPSWNPMGTHAWQFMNCTVKSAADDSGPVSSDPVIGAGVQSTDQPTPAKLVDLDTEQQMVSQIWGLQVRVAVSDSEYFTGNFRVVCFNDIWVRVGGGQPDSMFSAFYQSVLDDVTWSGRITSPLLQRLREVSPDALSIKFNVDGYDDDSISPTFNQGRVVGAIGPAWKNEPPNFVLGRFLRPLDYNQKKNPFGGTPLWFAPARVDEKRGKVLVDLGNSIPTTSPAGTAADLGNLKVAIMTSPKPTVLGDYDYSNVTYALSAGVQEFAVTKEQLKTLSTTPLGVLQQGAAGAPKAVLRENDNGAYLNVTEQVQRMAPGDKVKVELIALAFGKPAAKESIEVKFNNGMLQGVPGIPVGAPASALDFPSSATTNAKGRAHFTLKASDPGNPRKFIDGQVYGVGYAWSKEADKRYPPDPNNFVSVLVFDKYPTPPSPTWADVEPIFAQYAKLYPFMTQKVVNLASYADVVNNLDAIKGVLSLPPTDPRYMQVTRDMSPDKVSLVLKWIAQGAPPAPNGGGANGEAKGAVKKSAKKSAARKK
jgi:hypothetical protein